MPDLNASPSNVVGIIPARWASSRFPGKPLAKIGGRPMIEWVYRSAAKASSLDELIVATDDRRILEAVEAFGGKALMTSPDHRTGTDRCAEVAAGLSAGLIVNIQGDEPFASATQIDQLTSLLHQHTEHSIATLARLLPEPADIANPHLVKVVFDNHQKALYFSRATIPYPRHAPAPAYQHIGLYAFRRHTLLALQQLAPGRLEQTESLEQLRWLEHSYAIGVGITTEQSLGVDVPADILRAEAWIIQNDLCI